MIRYALKRIAMFPVLLLAIYAAAVGLVAAAPGEGLETGEKELPPEVLAQKRIAYNYDQPALKRYFWTWPKRLLWDRDLPAHQYPDWTVVEIMASALPVSLQLGVMALAIAVMLGVGAGVVAGARAGTWLDKLTLMLALVGVSLPTFVIGAALLLIAGLHLGWAPVGGWGRPSQALLPALTLALPYAAYIARLTRGAIIDAYLEDYVRTARAKGLSETRVLFEHVLRNALLPVLSYLGPAAAAIFTGSFVVEKIFSIPGMGTHVVESINNRDQTLILATVMIYSMFLATFNLLVDVMYGWVDPRIRVGERVT
ncbi:MAG: ABC transporter permease [Planctomycetota bacterium]|nr:MAG: ABC transporter permease [Planctomycetota bacterium]